MFLLFCIYVSGIVLSMGFFACLVESRMSMGDLFFIAVLWPLILVLLLVCVLFIAASSLYAHFAHDTMLESERLDAELYKRKGFDNE